MTMANLVLLHGFCETSDMWSDITPQLMLEGHQVTCIDLPGFGENRNCESSIVGIANYVWGVLSQKAITDPVVLGHSMGGYVALEMLSQKPREIKGIGLIHSHAAADTEDKKANRNKSISFVQKHGTKEFLDLFPNQLVAPHRVSDLDLMDRVQSLVTKTRSEAIIAASKAMRDRPERISLLNRVETPILWLVGEQDGFVTVSEIYQQVSKAQRSMLEVLPNVGHLSVLEIPEQFLKSVNKYLNWIEA